MTSQYLVLGKNGQLGLCLTRLIASAPNAALLAAFGRDELDVSDRHAVSNLGAELELPANPINESVWLLNAAAYTAVDLCETEKDACHAVNGSGPGELANWCREHGVGLVHLSTDYVFDGDATVPYRETDQTAPGTEYGRSKLVGEQRVFESLPSAWVVRTSWVFGPGKNFVGAIVRQGVLRETGKVSEPLRVVDDQLGCPTYAADLARGILALTQLEGASVGGLIHLSNAEPCSFWDFARAILDGTGYGDLQIDRIKTRDFPTPAPRPAYSVLDGSKARSLGIALRSWREALDDYLQSDDFAALHGALRAEAQAAP
jgi:dTDP-4-dehydrorhamnose reductase